MVEDGLAEEEPLVLRIETRLALGGRRKLNGSSDSSFWASPLALWRDETYRKTWYVHARRYWEDAVVAPPTLNGVLGGFAQLARPDAAFSLRFLREAVPHMQPGFAAADIAAGIGRVAKHVLLPAGAGHVDVIEQSASLLRAAPDFLSARDGDMGGDEACVKCRFLCSAMQRWVTRPGDYDVIWVQWSVGHLTDADFIAFLFTCRNALRQGGILVVKDNVLHDSSDVEADAFYVDDDDRSVCRSLAYYRALFDEAGAVIALERQQPVGTGSDAFPADIYPVFAWALTWPDSHDSRPASLRAYTARSNPGDDVQAPPADTCVRGLGEHSIYGW